MAAFIISRCNVQIHQRNVFTSKLLIGLQVCNAWLYHSVSQRTGDVNHHGLCTVGFCWIQILQTTTIKAHFPNGFSVAQNVHKPIKWPKIYIERSTARMMNMRTLELFIAVHFSRTCSQYPETVLSPSHTWNLWSGVDHHRYSSFSPPFYSPLSPPGRCSRLAWLSGQGRCHRDRWRLQQLMERNGEMVMKPKT